VIFRKSPLAPFYGMSYFWYTMFSIFIALIVSVVVSYFTGKIQRENKLFNDKESMCLLGFTKPESIDPQLMLPVFDILCPFLPERILSKLRFGVRYRQDSTQVNKIKLRLLFISY
jgi:hypothetical protein